MAAPLPTFPNYFSVQHLAEEGMGCVLLVEDFDGNHFALKYCSSPDPEFRARFGREIRIQKGYAWSPLVMSVLYDNLNHDPPFFVMPYAAGGNLVSRAPFTHPPDQERLFARMIECTRALHTNGHYHRDIKPQNFLILNPHDPVGSLVIADFGLAKHTSGTTYTRTGAQGGTEEYAPPEYFAGEFRVAGATWDIYTLGKSFYRLLTGRHALHMVQNGVPVALYKVLSRCCEIDREKRYQTLDELALALRGAFDVVLDRTAPGVSAFSLAHSIQSRLAERNVFDPQELYSFVDYLGVSDPSAQKQICTELSSRVFQCFTATPELFDSLRELLKMYGEMVLEGAYGFPFAEKIAKSMDVVFRSQAPADIRSQALELAIHAGYVKNRYVAWDTCVDMIHEMPGEDMELGAHVAAVVRTHAGRDVNHFLRSKLNPLLCRNRLVATAINEIRA